MLNCGYITIIDDVITFQGDAMAAVDENFGKAEESDEDDGVRI